MADYELNETGEVLVWIDPYIETLTIPEGVKEIAVGCLDANKYSVRPSKLKRVIFPSTLQTIDNFAFMDQPLMELDLSKCIKLTTIGESAFSDCEFEKVKLSPFLKTIYTSAFSKNHNLTEVVFPYNDLVLFEEVFAECYKLQKANLDNIVRMGRAAFRNCDLREVKIDKIIAIAPSVFENNKNLISVILPNAVEFHEHAFLNCTSLKNINLGKPAFLENESFKNTGLEAINLNVTIAYADAFAECKNLKDVHLEANTIFPRLFTNCKNLKNVYLNGKLVNGQYAINQFSNLDNLTLGPDTEIDTEGFGKLLDGANISTLNLYRTAEAEFAPYTFKNITAGSLILSPAVTYIRPHAFKDCTISNLIITGTDITFRTNYTSKFKNIIFTAENIKILEETFCAFASSNPENIFMNDKMIEEYMPYIKMHNCTMGSFPIPIPRPLSEYFKATGFRLENRINNLLMEDYKER